MISRTMASLLCICMAFLAWRAFPAISTNAPTRISCDLLADPKFVPVDQERYVVEGTVEDVMDDDIDTGHVFLILRNGGSTVPIAVNRHQVTHHDLRTLIGAHVRLVGTILGSYVETARFHRERLFDALGSDISILKSNPDLFQVPVLRTDCHIGPRELAAMGRRRICGHVLAFWQNKNILMRSPSGQVVGVEMAEDGVPPVGAFIETVGFPETDLYRINLQRSVWRPSAPFSVESEKAEAVSYTDIIKAANGNKLVQHGYHAKLIRISGRVRGISNPPNGQKTLYLENEGRIIAVQAAFDAKLPDGTEIGCQAEITGRCVMIIDNWLPQTPFPKFKWFEIVVNEPSGICITERIPWWTPARLAIVIVSLFAVLIGIFIWNISLRRLAERRGRELARGQLRTLRSQLQVEERTRLAVELHDTIAQNLTGVSMEIEAANDLRGAAPQPMLDRLGIAAKVLKSCRDELRNCLWDLRSQALDEKDMTNAILRTLQPHVSDTNLAVRFNVPRTRLSDNTAHALLRVIRELAVNAIRHGEATSVKIAGTLDGGRLLGSVTDNGKGFDPDLAPGVLQGHFGIQGIRERIEELGGDFTLASEPGKGTKAIFAIPVPKEKPAN